MNSSLKLVVHTRTWDGPACYIQSLIRRMDKSIECPALAGRVAHFQTNWELLTQDKWVLQTVGGYQLELLGVPYQARHPPPTRVSLENQAQISAEVSELLSGCNSRDKGINRPICFSTFSGREKGWGAETSDQPEGAESICEG